jgi:hypothetical protein
MSSGLKVRSMPASEGHKEGMKEGMKEASSLTRVLHAPHGVILMSQVGCVGLPPRPAEAALQDSLQQSSEATTHIMNNNFKSFYIIIAS